MQCVKGKKAGKHCGEGDVAVTAGLPFLFRFCPQMPLCVCGSGGGNQQRQHMRQHLAVCQGTEASNQSMGAGRVVVVAAGVPLSLKYLRPVEILHGQLRIKIAGTNFSIGDLRNACHQTSFTST